VLAPATTVNCFRWLSTIMRAAVADRLIPISPCEGVKLPRIERDLVVPFTTGQVLDLVDAAPDRFRAMVVTAAGSGLRQGELLGLDVSRVDFLHRTIRIDRQLITPAKGAPYFAPPKTDASRRVVPVADEVLAVLSEHVREHVEPGVLLFTSGDGRPLRRQRAAELWRTTVAGAPSVEPGARLHDLRHYFASLLISQGASVKAVQHALGHASASETLETYSHLWPDDGERVRAAVSGVLGVALGEMRDSRGTGGLISGEIRRSEDVVVTSRPVRRILSRDRSPGGGHPSRRAVTDTLQRSTREHRAGDSLPV
jgi:integrase